MDVVTPYQSHSSSAKSFLHLSQLLHLLEEGGLNVHMQSLSPRVLIQSISFFKKTRVLSFDIGIKIILEGASDIAFGLNEQVP